MIQNSDDGYAIEFSEGHDPEKVILFSKRCTPAQRAELLRRHISGWAIFKLKHGDKTPTGRVEKTEEKAKAIVAHWLRLDRERAAKAARRAIAKANQLAELAGNDPVDVDSLMTKLYGVEKVIPVKEVAPYVWDVTEADRILARGLGTRL